MFIIVDAEKKSRRMSYGDDDDDVVRSNATDHCKSPLYLALGAHLRHLCIGGVGSVVRLPGCRAQSDQYDASLDRVGIDPSIPPLSNHHVQSGV